jgi:hypothetical protein
MPEAKVVAFEIDPNASQLLRQTIALNGVQDRVEVLGRCDPEALDRKISTEPRTLVFCDVEGYEKQLLSTPVPYAAWRASTCWSRCTSTWQKAWLTRSAPGSPRRMTS